MMREDREMLKESVKKILEGELLTPTEYFDFVNTGGTVTILKMIVNGKEIASIQMYGFEENEGYIFYSDESSRFTLYEDQIKEVKGKIVPGTNDLGILCHLENGIDVVIYVLGVLDEDEDEGDDEDMMSTYIKNSLGESDISIEDIERILELEDEFLMGDIDERKKIVLKISEEFGIEIPMLSWSGMTVEELEEYYDNLKYPCGC